MVSHFRAHERTPVAFAGLLRPVVPPSEDAGSASGAAVEARAFDLSVAGVGLEITGVLSPVVAVALVPGKPVEVELSVPTYWDPVRVPGEVAWVREGRGRARGALLVGVRFRLAAPADLAPLTRVLGGEPGAP